MSFRFTRLLIVWLIAMAIPLQGMAAAAAGVCMSLGHHDAAHDATMSAGHEHDADHSADEKPQEAHCAPCVACCAAASIAPTPHMALPVLLPDAAIAASAAPPAGSVPETLDRPPLAL